MGISAASIRSWITFDVTTDGRFVPEIDQAKAQATIEKLAAKINRKPSNATFLLGKSGRIVGVTAGKTVAPSTTRRPPRP